MSTLSNNTGRALEYAITVELIMMLDNLNIPYALTTRTINDNKRDLAHFNLLSSLNKKEFMLTSEIFSKWVDNEGWFNDAKEVLIDRLPDKEGVEGNVTDIELKIRDGRGTETKNLSIKHNHDALKHPRLPRLPIQCGISGKAVNLKWKKTHQAIWEKFIKNSKKLDQRATLFNELKLKDPKYIDEKLYKPLINAVISFLNEKVNNPEGCKNFFTFLVNKRDFYAVKDESEQVVIKKFAEIPLPTSFEIEYPYLKRLNTFLIKFNNGWRLTMRLHTASSRMYKPDGGINTSTKFDVLCLNLNELIEMVHLKK